MGRPASAAARPELASLRFDAIGTAWQIDTARPLGTDAEEAVLRRCEDFDRVWSRFRADSLVGRLSAAPGRVVLPAESIPLQRLYRELYEATDGALSPSSDVLSSSTDTTAATRCDRAR